MECLGSISTRWRKLRWCSKVSGGASDDGHVANSRHFPLRNWVMVILMRMVLNVVYVIPLLSMHQFVTNPSTISRSENEDSSMLIWPGMDQSEHFYAWVVAGFHIGAVIGSLGAALLLKLLPYRYCFLLSLSLGVLGNISYVLGNPSQAWFTLIGRLIAGLSFGCCLSLQVAYLAETGMVEESGRQQQSTKPRKTLKDKLFLFYNFASTSSYMVAPGISAVMSQFPSVDPYRWGAWFSVALIAVYTVAFMIVFRAEWRCKQYKCKGSFACGREPRSSPWGLKNWMLFIFLSISAYTLVSGYVILDTLINPILSDHFGFTVEDSSYFMLCSLAVLIGGSILLLILMELRINNRKILALAICLMTIGLAITGDWQGIGHDPCLTASSNYLNRTNSTPAVDTNSSQTDIDVQGWYVGNESLELLLNESLHDDLLEAANCKAHSSSVHMCYWNPISPVTGKLCKDCDQTCRSVQKSLNIVQFAIGVTLLTSCTPVATIVANLVTSDFIPLEYQYVTLDKMHMLLYICESVPPSRAKLEPRNPFRSYPADKLYESTGKHTYPISAVMIVNETVILIGICVLYKLLAPRRSQHGVHMLARAELELSSLDGDSNSMEKGDETNLCEVDRDPTQVNDDDSTESVHVHLDGEGLDLPTESAPLLNEGEATNVSLVDKEVVEKM